MATIVKKSSEPKNRRSPADCGAASLSASSYLMFIGGWQTSLEVHYHHQVDWMLLLLFIGSLY